MKIAVISCWFNEEKLAHLFLKSHSYADRIFILGDTASTDKSIEMAKGHGLTSVEPLDMVSGLDDKIKIAAINTKSSELAKDFDWIVAVDADEFVSDNIRERLSAGPGFGVFNLGMWNLYRHKTDFDFDPMGSLFQRRHGVRHDLKPCIVKSSEILRGSSWTVGCHFFSSKSPIHPIPVIGTHWNSADPSIAIERRMTRKQRMSATNIKSGFGFHNFNITEKKIMSECNDHLDDPLVL